MGAASLVGPDIDGAERLITTLEAEGVPITAAFWVHPTEETGWRLLIASPTVPTEGALPIYRRVQDTLDSMQPARLTLDDIFVVSAVDPLVVQLRATVPPGYPVQGSDVTVPVRHYAAYLPDSAATATLHVHRLAQDDAPAVQQRSSS